MKPMASVNRTTTEARSQPAYEAPMMKNAGPTAAANTKEYYLLFAIKLVKKLLKMSIDHVKTHLFYQHIFLYKSHEKSISLSVYLQNALSFSPKTT